MCFKQRVVGGDGAAIEHGCIFCVVLRVSGIAGIEESARVRGIGGEICVELVACGFPVGLREKSFDFLKLLRWSIIRLCGSRRDLLLSEDRDWERDECKKTSEQGDRTKHEIPQLPV